MADSSSKRVCVSFIRSRLDRNDGIFLEDPDNVQLVVSAVLNAVPSHWEPSSALLVIELPVRMEDRVDSVLDALVERFGVARVMLVRSGSTFAHTEAATHEATAMKKRHPGRARGPRNWRLKDGDPHLATVCCGA
jgi:hypothetical protein